MNRNEFSRRMQQIDPESHSAMDLLADLFEEDYATSGTDLTNAAVSGDIETQAREDLAYYREQYDELKTKVDGELRKAGATEAQINWGLFENIELPTMANFNCNRWAKRLIGYSYQILYCLAELKMISKYRDIDLNELKQIQKDYGRRYG